jgi:RNA polymerase sigma-70 factor (ECF subfamily)
MLTFGVEEGRVTRVWLMLNPEKLSAWSHE